MNSNNFLYIEPFVFIAIKNKKALLYNTLNGAYIECKSNSLTGNLIKQLSLSKNLLVISLSEQELKELQIIRFINKIRKYFIGDIIKESQAIYKPIQLKPILSIQNYVTTNKKTPISSIGKKVMNYLTNITLHINNECNLKCRNCQDSFKQFIFCTKKQDAVQEIDIIYLKKAIEDFKATSINRINITGGDLFKYSKLQELNSLLLDYSHLVEYHIHYQNIISNKDNIKSLLNHSKINILVDIPFLDVSLIRELQELFYPTGIQSVFSFLVESDKDLNSVENLVKDLGIQFYNITPYFNRDNIVFFENRVFFTKEDIFEAKPSMNDILKKKEINPIYFGNIIIMSDGYIYANCNSKELGNIKEVSLYDAVYKEMQYGLSWKKLRSKIAPCKDCLYNLICPPISNYEDCIGKPNLCNNY